MHRRCIRNGLMVSRVILAQVMKHLDPIGVSTRRRRILRHRLYYRQGQNWICHLDGYDKLMSYGFQKHGCKDGYSRRVLWLYVIRSNKDYRSLPIYSMKISKSRREYL